METAELARQAMAIYENRLKAPLEISHPDYFVAIEPVSGDYFLGETLVKFPTGGYALSRNLSKAMDDAGVPLP